VLELLQIYAIAYAASAVAVLCLYALGIDIGRIVADLAKAAL